MRKLLDYTVVHWHESDLMKLRKDVKTLADNGYELVGGISRSDDWHLYQAMALYEKPGKP